MVPVVPVEVGRKLNLVVQLPHLDKAILVALVALLLAVVVVVLVQVVVMVEQTEVWAVLA